MVVCISVDLWWLIGEGGEARFCAAAFFCLNISLLNGIATEFTFYCLVLQIDNVAHRLLRCRPYSTEP